MPKPTTSDNMDPGTSPKSSPQRPEPNTADIASTPDNVLALIEDLRVHQIELEVQNEELCEAQLALAAARDGYLDLYELAPVGYLTVDSERRVIEGNLTAAHMLGVDRQDLIGSQFEKSVVLECRDTFYLYFQSMLKRGSKQSCELEFCRTDGTSFIGRLESVPVEEKTYGKTAYRMTLSDITEARRASDAMRMSEERLRLALDAGQMGTWDHDLITGKTVWSPKVYELLGHDPGDAAITGETLFEYVHPDDLPRVWGLVSRALQSVKSEFDDEFRIVQGDRNDRWLALRGEVFRNEAGLPLRVNGVIFDTTKSKITEQRWSDLNVTLERRVAERTAELVLLRDVASMSNLAQDLEDAILFCLGQVARHYDWCCGHAFLQIDDEGGELVSSYTFSETEAEASTPPCNATLGVVLRCFGGLPRRASANRKTEWTTDIEAEFASRGAKAGDTMGIVGAVAFPVMIESHLAGVLEFFSRESIQPDSDMLDVMTSIGTQLGRVIERKQFQDHLLTIAEEQQRQIGQELHDDIGQELTGLALTAESLAEKLTDGNVWERDVAARLVTALDRTRKKTRAVSRGLIPVELDAKMLGGALEAFASLTFEATGVRCTVDHRKELPGIDNRMASQLYRIVQEAVNNAICHGHAKNICILLRLGPSDNILQIQDDGVGILEKDGWSQGMGVRIMRYRTGLIGGHLEFALNPDGGTLVTCRFQSRQYDGRR